MNADRRPLQFASLDAIMPDVERLLQGHKTVGSWTLGQICEHLATTKTLLVDLPADTPNDPALRVGDEKKQEVFQTGQLPEGMPMPGKLQTPDAVPDAEGAEHLRQAIAYYQSKPGPVIEHRFFGPLSPEEWHRLMCIHSAHHLSFALPEN